jgi:hypothetical protein
MEHNSSNYLRRIQDSTIYKFRCYRKHNHLCNCKNQLNFNIKIGQSDRNHLNMFYKYFFRCHIINKMDLHMNYLINNIIHYFQLNIQQHNFNNYVKYQRRYSYVIIIKLRNTSKIDQHRIH